mmetsp:Transcript_27373/g.37757  ORF Transcript_27373/g.37757 Transcript_27373/m.37757 type:complete len:227 (+) Transcript_27373:968-1648(+)
MPRTIVAEEFLDFEDGLGVVHKRESVEIHSLLHTKLEIRPILLRDGGQIRSGAPHVQVPAGLEHTALQYNALYVLLRHLCHLQALHACVHEDDVEFADVLNKVVVVHGGLVLAERAVVVDGEGEFHAGLQVNGSLQVPRSHLRPLCVQQNANRCVAGGEVVLLDKVHHFLVALVVAMGHVEARNVHPRRRQSEQRLPLPRRWSNGAHDLGLADLVAALHLIPGPLT